MTKIDPIKLQSDLDQFHGTQEYTRWSPLFRSLVLTDGAKYLAEKAGAFWFMDLIASHQSNPKVKTEYFQVWKFIRQGEGALIVCEDGNYNKITQQEVEYSDFPLDNFALWAIEGGPQNTRVIMLPSEH
jgi:hypothetical protein